MDHKTYQRIKARAAQQKAADKGRVMEAANGDSLQTFTSLDALIAAAKGDSRLP